MTTVYQPNAPQVVWSDAQLKKLKEEMENKFNVQQDSAQMAFKRDLNDVLDSIGTLLLQKNAAYGDSALNPVRIFSKASPLEQLKVRMDDKLSRLARGDEAGEDVIQDLLGYLIIYKIQQKRIKNQATNFDPT